MRKAWKRYVYRAQYLDWTGGGGRLGGPSQIAMGMFMISFMISTTEVPIQQKNSACFQ